MDEASFLPSGRSDFSRREEPTAPGRVVEVPHEAFTCVAERLLKIVCYSFHGEVESKSPPLESGLALVTPLTKRL